MKIESGTVTILRITEVPRLDPIRVTLDNGELGKGRITIECYSKAWSAYWGAMSDRTVEQFFVDCSNDYLISNLSVGLDSSRPSGDALERDAKRVIRHRRKGIGEWKYTPLTADAAEELMKRVHVLQECNDEGSAWANASLLAEIYGEDWRDLAKCSEPNPDWMYLERICDAVREALKTVASQAKAQDPAPAPADQAVDMPDFDLRTSEGGRGFVAWYFANVLQRYDYEKYITTRLAADFACDLAKALSTPQAQADARDAVNEWQEISTMPTCDDLIWLYCQETNTTDGPIAPDPILEQFGWTHWSYANAPSTAVIDRAAIAAAKGD